MEDMQGSNFALFIKFIAVGIMIFMVCLGGVVLLKALPADGGGAAPAVPTILGMIPLMWRRNKCQSQ